MGPLPHTASPCASLAACAGAGGKPHLLHLLGVQPGPCCSGTLTAQQRAASRLQPWSCRSRLHSPSRSARYLLLRLLLLLQYCVRCLARARPASVAGK